MSRRRQVILGIGLLIVAAFISLQLIPPERIFPDFKYLGNPPIDPQVKWDSPQTEQLARMACFDCHSNETNYPWYAHIAPVSWLINRDVNVARDNLNFSTWGKQDVDISDVVDQIQSGAMPLPIYLPLHPQARLTDEQKTQLINGLEATFGN